MRRFLRECMLALQNGVSCLHWACEGGYLDVVKYVCHRGGQKLLMLENDVSVGVCAWLHLCYLRFAKK